MGPDLGPNCLRRFSADDKRVKKPKLHVNHLLAFWLKLSSICTLCVYYDITIFYGKFIFI